MRRARSSCLCRQTRSPACQRPRGSANSPVLTMPSRLRRIRSRNGDAARINSRVEVWRGGLGPYAPPIDNLLSMSLRRDFECVRVIRCRFIFSGKDDELTPDFPRIFSGKDDELTPDFPRLSGSGTVQVQELPGAERRTSVDRLAVHRPERCGGPGWSRGRSNGAGAACGRGCMEKMRSRPSYRLGQWNAPWIGPSA